jgi:hypothetical protein
MIGRAGGDSSQFMGAKGSFLLSRVHGGSLDIISQKRGYSRHVEISKPAFLNSRFMSSVCQTLDEEQEVEDGVRRPNRE